MKLLGFLCTYLCLTSLLLAENEGKGELEELGLNSSSSIQETTDNFSSLGQSISIQETSEESSSLAKTPSVQESPVDFSSVVQSTSDPSSVVQATKEIPQQQMPASTKQQKNYPSPGRLQAKHGCNLVLRGDFLWWKAKEEGLNYAATTIESAQPPTPLSGATGTVHRINSDYHSGFRAGVGYNIPHDFWDLSALWTYFHPETSHAHAIAPIGGALFPYWMNENFAPTATEAAATWHVHLDTLDALIGKTFWAGKFFTFRPQGGFRASWIDQSLKMKSSNVTFSNGSTTPFIQDQLSCDFEGYGLNLGLNSKWFFTSNFNLFVNGAASLLWSKFENSTKETLPDNSTRVHMKDTLFSTTPELEMAAGLEYYTTFLEDSCYLQFSIAWEESVWFNLNQILQNSNAFTHGKYENKTGNLSFTGLTFSTVFGF